MIKLFTASIAFFLLALVLFAQAPAITPLTPVVNQGATQSFSCTSNCGTGGSWSCNGCAGSINSSTGVYTAPATVTPQQTSGGYQLLPNNDVFNENIASLPVNSNSSTWIALITNHLNLEPSFCINYGPANTTPESMVFDYTPANNGTFEVPTYPTGCIQAGWLAATEYNYFGTDHHLLLFDTSTQNFSELYQFYPVGANSGCPTCNSQSGLSYSDLSYALPSGGNATTAAGMQFWPLTDRLQEVEQAVATGGTVNHAVYGTINANAMAKSFIWPATNCANDGGSIPFGARFRLKSSFDISGFSAIAQVFLKQLQQFGFFAVDGGPGLSMAVEDTHWPLAYVQAFNQLANANITASDFEAVDESGWEVAASSGETTQNRETVRYTSSTGTTTTDVILQGVAVTLPKDVIYIQAGSPAITLSALVNIGSVTWSMSPALGTLNSRTGQYTPPATQTGVSSTTITATSSTNSSIAAALTLVTVPNGTIRLVPGQASNYTDSQGNVWYAGALATGDARCGSSESCFRSGNGGTWPSDPDITLYEIPIYSYNDLRYDIYVSNGTYAIDAKVANNSAGNSSQGNQVFELNGAATSPMDVYSLVGNNEPYDWTQNVTVSGGLLSFVERAINTTGNEIAPFISALEITPEAEGSGSAPLPPTDLNAVIH